MELVDLSISEVVKKIEDVLTKQLPLSQKILSTVRMHQKYAVKGLQLFRSNDAASSEDSIIWVAIQEDDLSCTKFTNSMYVKESEENMKRFRQIMSTWLDWNKEQSFMGTPNYIVDVIVSLAKEKEGWFPLHLPGDLFMLDKLEDLSDTECPADAQVRKLSMAEKDLAVTNWTYASIVDRNILESQVGFSIRNGLGFGIFVEGELAAWVLISGYGTLSMLTTMSKYRRRGFAQLCSEAISRQFYQDTGIQPYAHVREENAPSRSLFAKMGFKKISQRCADYLVYLPKGQEPTEAIKARVTLCLRGT